MRLLFPMLWEFCVGQVCCCGLPCFFRGVGMGVCVVTGEWLVLLVLLREETGLLVVLSRVFVVRYSLLNGVHNG